MLKPFSTIKSVQSEFEIDNETKANLLSLASASSSSMRVLAVRNLQFYPEHLDILISLITTESEELVLDEVKSSLLILHKNDTMKDVLESEIDKIKKHADKEELKEYCAELLQVMEKQA